MAGLYATNGTLNVTVVSGSALTALHAADGSWNVVSVPGSSITGIMHACGAYNVVNNITGISGTYAPCGAFFVQTTPFTTGGLKVTVVSGSL